jgi:hypothetical protein
MVESRERAPAGAAASTTPSVFVPRSPAASCRPAGSAKAVELIGFAVPTRSTLRAFTVAQFATAPKLAQVFYFVESAY